MVGSTLVDIPKPEENDSQIECAFYSYVKACQEQMCLPKESVGNTWVGEEH